MRKLVYICLLYTIYTPRVTTAANHSKFFPLAIVLVKDKLTAIEEEKYFLLANGISLRQAFEAFDQSAHGKHDILFRSLRTKIYRRKFENDHHKTVKHMRDNDEKTIDKDCKNLNRTFRENLNNYIETETDLLRLLSIIKGNAVKNIDATLWTRIWLIFAPNQYKKLPKEVVENLRIREKNKRSLLYLEDDAIHFTSIQAFLQKIAADKSKKDPSNKSQDTRTTQEVIPISQSPSQVSEPLQMDQSIQIEHEKPEGIMNSTLHRGGKSFILMGIAALTGISGGLLFTQDQLYHSLYKKPNPATVKTDVAPVTLKK